MVSDAIIILMLAYIIYRQVKYPMGKPTTLYVNGKGKLLDFSILDKLKSKS